MSGHIEPGVLSEHITPGALPKNISGALFDHHNRQPLLRIQQALFLITTTDNRA
jgi:hypothetical protein